jgi:hypothetical protein
MYKSDGTSVQFHKILFYLLTVLFWITRLTGTFLICSSSEFYFTSPDLVFLPLKHSVRNHQKMWFKKVTELKDEDVIEHNNELSEIKITSNGQAIYTKKPEAAKGQSTSTDFISVDAIRALRRFSKEHELDPNLPLDELDEVDEVLKDGNAEKGAEVERVLLEENSPYPEVTFYIHE